MTIRSIGLMLLLALGAMAQQEAPRGIYVIFDGSGSMWGRLPDSTHKITAAKQVLTDFAAGDFPGSELALRAYGHRKKGDCKDSELVIPFGPASTVAPRMEGFMKGVNPLGKTPISLSLRQALADFGDRAGEIILITDGIETCDEDPCELVRAWRESNVAIRVHVVGLGLDAKARSAIECIAKAAGTEYHDAQSAAALAESLTTIQKKSAPARATTASLVLRGIDSDGNAIRVQGTLERGGEVVKNVSSNGRHCVEAGDYQLVAGVMTRNGNLYRPVTREVTVAPTGDTVVEVKVAPPPSVKAKFIENGKEMNGAHVYAYQNNKEVFSFRWMDRVFVNEGAYEFRSNPNQDNKLSVRESFAAGDSKEIVFEMATTVHVMLKLVASGSGDWYRHNYELWQGDEKKYSVHVHNGARVAPGAYSVVMPDDLTPHRHNGLVVTAEAAQTFEIEVPSAHLTAIYQTAAGSRETDKRYFLYRGSRGKTKQSGQTVALTPGVYKIVGWRGNYDPVQIELKAGDTREVVLRDKP